MLLVLATSGICGGFVVVVVVVVVVIVVVIGISFCSSIELFAKYITYINCIGKINLLSHLAPFRINLYVLAKMLSCY